jgi:hypothetical protein
MPEDERLAVHVRIERREGRRAERIGWLAVVLVVVAVMKPWGKLGDPPAPARGGAFATPVSAPTREPIAADLPCVGGRWSIEADERWVGTVVRTWVLTDSVDATGPEDGRIRFVTVAAEQVIALGWCPPFHDAEPNTTATFFRLDPDATAILTTPVQMRQEAEAMANILFQPAPIASAGTTPTWPDGRYVIRIDGQDGYRRWLWRRRSDRGPAGCPRGADAERGSLAQRGSWSIS